jgi:recombination protein RecA
MGLAFLKQFKKDMEKMSTVTMDFSAPSFWYSTGNLAVNNIIAGSFNKGIPQGRITCLAGPSGSGKSFLLCNILKHAQEEGAIVFVMDSEHALDTGYMTKIGMNLSEDKFIYAGVTMFSDCVQVLSEFIGQYVKEYGYDNPNAPKVVLALDSLDMLITDSENNNFEKGEQKGDQGQRAKQAKHMLRTIVSRIKRLPMAFILTHQVYPNTDLLNGQGLWIINNAVRYSASQILLITNGKLKDGTEVTGIRLRVEAYKSRFAKLGSKVEVEVPYAAGMNPYSGLLDILEDKGVVKSAGAWKSFEMPGEDVIKFQTKHVDAELVAKLLSHPLIQEEEKNVQALMDTENLGGDSDEDEDAPKPKRSKKAAEPVEQGEEA